MSTSDQALDQEILVGRAGTSRWAAYPSYRDCGIDWLGGIPTHWATRRLKFIAPLKYGDSLASDTREDGSVAVYGSNGPVGVHSRPNTDAPVIVVGRKGSFGKVNYSSSPVFAIDTTYFIDRRQCSADLKWLFYALPLLGLDKISADSAIPGLSREYAYEMVLPYPSIKEQRAIAVSLDRETAKIDALIAKKERLIALLQEKRAALISRAVTKGLDPSVTMKDSGIEWLGEIPAHWEIRRIAMSVAKITNGYVGPTRDILVTEGVRYLQSLHIKEGEIRFDCRYFVTDEWSREHGKSILHIGDVLLVQTGSIGQCAAVNADYQGCNCHALIILQLKDGLGSGFYLSAVLRSHYGLNCLLEAQTGALHPHLECGKVREIRIPLPPNEEQIQILAALEAETLKIDRLAAAVRGAIERLSEYRTALVSAAVTGKIDVRGEAKA